MSLQSVQKQTVSLKMTPQVQQSLHMLQLSAWELTSYVQEAVNENPLLEMEAAAELPVRSKNRKESRGSDPVDRLSRFPDRAETLESRLIGQLRLMKLPPAIRKAAEFLAGCVDEGGFLTISDEEACAYLNGNPDVFR